MKKSWSILFVLVAALAAFEFWSISSQNAKAARLRVLLSTTYANATALEREIGFGGLIHNFKNFLLRPTEREYLLAARRNAVNAAALTWEIEKNVHSVGIAIDLSQTRMMIDAYNSRLDLVDELISKGTRPVDIDAVVRFDDSSALKELEQTLSALAREIETQSSDIQSAVIVQAIIITIMGITALWIGFAAAKEKEFAHKQRLANIQLQDVNSRLSDANTALRQFAGIASHDMKAPIRHIAMFSSMIKADIDDRAGVLAHAEKIEFSSRRLDRLIDSLLEFTKTAFRKPQRAQVDLGDVVEEVIDSLNGPIDASGAEIHVGPLPRVHADEHLLYRVFQNLIENSLKYARADTAPVIRIFGYRSGRQVIVTVEDNGIGVPGDYAQQIFEPLRRLHRDEKQYGGVGIGLSLVKSIIEGHGGAVRLDPTCPKGARIIFSLPAYDSEAGEDEAAPVIATEAA